MTDKTIVLFSIGIISTLVLLAAIGGYGYKESKEIGEIPCLGCLALNMKPKGIEGFVFTTTDDRPHPEYILEELNQSVVFLHFRTKNCDGCDKIEPTILDIEKEYPQVTFAHIHLLYEGDSGDIPIPTKEERDLYELYDTVLADTGKSGGVPMMVIITLNEDENGYVKPYYLTEFNADLTHNYFREMLDAALEMHERQSGHKH